MSTIIGVIVAFAFFEWPWRALVLAGFLLFDAFEIYIWLRWRNRRALTGAEALVGMSGKAISDCQPEGQVRVKGQTWKATAPEGAGAGDDIVVTKTRDLQLEVRRA